MTRKQAAFLEGVRDGLVIAVVGIMAALLAMGIWAVLVAILGTGWALALAVSTMVACFLLGLLYASASFDEIEEDDQ